MEFINVFGLYVVAPPSAPGPFVLHSANILAEYLDNDANGLPDDQAVLDYLVRNNYIVPVWTTSTREQFNQRRRGTPCEDGVLTAASMYYDEDIWALGGIRSAGTWDVNLEEIWHTVSMGWYNTYPMFFGADSATSSMLLDAMDTARGGQFSSIPTTYPDGAWYKYYDESCDYSCQAHEYFYWILMANLNALDSSVTTKCADSAHEWNVCNKRTLHNVDILAYDLLNNKGFDLPVNIPIGNYGTLDQPPAMVAMNAQPVAVDDTGDAANGGSVVIDVLANDSDTDNDNLSVRSVTQGSNGTVETSSGHYLPNHYNGSKLAYTHDGSPTTSDTFTYTLYDGFGGTVTGTVTVTVGGTAVELGGSALTDLTGLTSAVVDDLTLNGKDIS